MLRVVAVAVAIPTMFAAWAGPRVSLAAQRPAVTEGGQRTPNVDPPTENQRQTEGVERRTENVERRTENLKVSGCVARSTEAGVTGTRGQGAATAETLVLTRAQIVPEPSGRGAVPGAGVPAAANDSGTIGADQSRTPRVSAQSELSYELAGDAAALAAHVGKRIEVTGSVDVPVVAASGGAHPSSPRGLLKVRSFRALGGGCPLG